jgi:hypothetical protein
MTDTPVTILDHIERIAVPGLMFDRPANEYSSLVCFWEGMTFLYSIAKKCDMGGKRILDSAGEVKVISFGSDHRLDRIPTNLLSCVFQPNKGSRNRSSDQFQSEQDAAEGTEMICPSFGRVCSAGWSICIPLVVRRSPSPAVGRNQSDVRCPHDKSPNRNGHKEARKVTKSRDCEPSPAGPVFRAFLCLFVAIDLSHLLPLAF